MQQINNVFVTENSLNDINYQLPTEISEPNDEKIIENNANRSETLWDLELEKETEEAAKGWKCNYR